MHGIRQENAVSGIIVNSSQEHAICEGIEIAYIYFLSWSKIVSKQGFLFKLFTLRIGFAIKKEQIYTKCETYFDPFPKQLIEFQVAITDQTNSYSF